MQPRWNCHHEVSGPNRVWIWDRSCLPTPMCGVFFYLQLVVGLYSLAGALFRRYSTLGSPMPSVRDTLPTGADEPS